MEREETLSSGAFMITQNVLCADSVQSVTISALWRKNVMFRKKGTVGKECTVGFSKVDFDECKI
jgi:hypothetical protein